MQILGLNSLHGDNYHTFRHYKIIMKETGTVKFFNATKGFGFITGANGKDHFVHSTSLNGILLNDGVRVEFETRRGQKGTEAFNVSILN